MLTELGSYDWQEVFKAEYATPTAVRGYAGSCETFTREDVAEVLAMDEGENDGAEWVGVFRLTDGRWVAIRAGCDYTGWG